jgi:hypothetical protein
MKKLIGKIMLCSAVIGVCMMSTGCSVLAYNMNKKDAYKEAAHRKNTPQAIKAYAMGDYVGIGVDLLATDVIFNSWGSFFTQLAGAGLDVGAVLGAKALIDGQNSRNSGSSSDVSGTGNSSVQVTSGDNSSVTVTGHNGDAETGAKE